jgi:hypothetical protein
MDGRVVERLSFQIIDTLLLQKKILGLAEKCYLCKIIEKENYVIQVYRNLCWCWWPSSWLGDGWVRPCDVGGI